MSQGRKPTTTSVDAGDRGKGPTPVTVELIRMTRFLPLELTYLLPVRLTVFLLFIPSEIQYAHMGEYINY